MILIEENFSANMLQEATANGEKKYFIEGVFAEANVKNRNGRIYEKSDMEKVVQKINEAAAKNQFILGHLDHPNTLEVKLDEVSHKIISARMEGNQVICKAEILDKTTKGATARALIESGIQIGVSTRGSGRINESTSRVQDFNFVTVDLVATPSCRTAYPESFMEGLQMGLPPEEIMEGFDPKQIKEDQEAQEFLKKKFLDIFEGLSSGTK